MRVQAFVYRNWVLVTAFGLAAFSLIMLALAMHHSTRHLFADKGGNGNGNGADGNGNAYGNANGNGGGYGNTSSSASPDASLLGFHDGD